ncbi:XRE family transcriptional regulator [Streptomyces phaeochromogenes]|uniref:XRE family transcriptional regulator n=1 Tax=Streptomyces phaeochromogenes TaxID=1923 RepID=UPI000AEFBFDB|nr:XRE family transcriptional regulator [Streptomyces phaeochromogenes]
MGAGFGQIDGTAPQEAQDLAARLRVAAERAGYGGVRELAAATSVGRTTVSDALTARRVPSWEKLAALLRGCEVQPNQGWAEMHQAAKESLVRQRAAAHSAGLVDQPEEQNRPVTVNPVDLSTFSIRAPYGDLPPRLRGRDELLELLEERLAAGESRVQVICGLGGCGKTAVALHLARNARDRGYRIFWLSASTPDRLITGMREVARELGAPENDIDAAWSGRVSATDLVWRYLDDAEQPWLLVIDNADEPAWLASRGRVPGDGTGWLRTSHAGMTLVTTRVANPGVWGSEADASRIGPLDPSDGRDVLLDLAGDSGDPTEALLLAERLDGLPLALKIAGSYLARSARGAGLFRRHGKQSGRVRSFTDYIDALGEAGTGFLDQNERWNSDNPDRETTYRRLIGRTWEISLDLLDEQRLPEARALMRIFSCFAPTPLPIELLDPNLIWGEGREVESKLERADRALEALVDLSLIDVVDVTPGAQSSRVDLTPCLVSHRLVLEANALRLGDSTLEERDAVWQATAKIVEKGSSRAPEFPRNWNWWRLISPHIVAALRVAPPDSEVLLPLLRAGLSAYAYHAFSNGFDTAGVIAGLLLQRSSALGESHPVRLSSRHRVMLSLLGEEQKITEGEEILSLQIESLGEEHPETLITRHDMALIRRRNGLTSAADEEAQLRAVLNARRRVLGSDDPYTLLTHSAVVGAMRARGKETHEIDNEYRALIEHTRSESPEDYKFLSLQNRHHMAHALDAANRFDEAEAEYRSVISELEESNGAGGKLYRDMMKCLADNLVSQKKEFDALHVLDDLIPWFDGSGEGRSPIGAAGLQARHKRADALRKCKRPAEAEREIRAVLEVRLQSVDSLDSLVLRERHCLAHALEDQDRCTEAREELQEVAAAYVDILGNEDAATRDVLSCLANHQYKHGDFSEALRLYGQVLAAEITVFGDSHAEVIFSRFLVQRCLLKMGRIGAAEALSKFEEIESELADNSGVPRSRLSVIRKTVQELREDVEG